MNEKYSEAIENYKKDPSLFLSHSLVENDELLASFGISIPNKSALPEVFLKLYPQDFMVEEVLKNGEVCTAEFKPLEMLSTSGKSFHVTLVKCNIGTLEAAEEIAKQLAVPVNSVGYAGLKDNDAITSQRISLTSIAAEKISGIRHPSFFLKDIEENGLIIKKGELKGNRFTILLRTRGNDPAGKKALLDSLKLIQENGFYNFYYLQRFGAPRLLNHYCGFLVLQGNYKEAVLAALCQKGKTDLNHINKIREEASAHFGEWKYLHDLFLPHGKDLYYEIRLVEHLAKHPEDFEGALRNVPDLVTIWVYASSSWLFNNRLSSLIKSSNNKIPKTLPLFLSSDQSNWESYRSLLSKLLAYPPNFGNILKVLPGLGLWSRYVNTKAKFILNGTETIDEGIVLSFTLGRGEYATTLLAHVCNMISYAPPQDISFNPVDSISSNGNPLKETFEGFAEAKKPVFA